jgi:transposase
LTALVLSRHEQTYCVGVAPEHHGPGKRYRAAHEPHERSWWQILWLLAKDQTATAIAESTGYTRYWIGQIARRYNAQGPEGMRNRQHTTSWRAPRMLSAEQYEELLQALADLTPEGTKHWRARDVADWIAAKLGRTIAIQRGWDYLQRLKHSQQVPQPQHAPADSEQQDIFKKSAFRIFRLTRQLYTLIEIRPLWLTSYQFCDEINPLIRLLISLSARPKRE